MSVNTEYCNPFENEPKDIWMKLEHCGRYLFACDFLERQKCHSVIDLAAANGYGSAMLAKRGFLLIAVDRNEEYLQSDYLADNRIPYVCIDFDEVLLKDHLPAADAVVCFETIEHLRKPYGFLGQLAEQILDHGWLLLSFPNAQFERFNADGTNRDPFHLHLIQLEEVCSFLRNAGFTLIAVLGQCLCNEICSVQHDLKEKGILSGKDVDSAFCYDEKSIRVLSRLLAYPSETRIENSYSYIVVAQKNGILREDSKV